MGGEWTPKNVPKPTQVRSPEVAPDSERERGARGAAVEVVPRPRARRTFTAAEKLRIVKKADACLASGKRGALEAMLRQEGIYSSLLSAWRSQVGAHGTAGLEPRKAGRKPKLDAQERRIVELEKRNAELERRLRVADALIDLQKKAHEILGIALPSLGGES